MRLRRVILCHVLPLLMVGALSAQKVEVDANAPGSNFPDLTKSATSLIESALEENLQEWGLSKGENVSPAGVMWVATGTAAVKGLPGSIDWGQDRLGAYMRAMLEAQAELVTYTGVKLANDQLDQKFRDRGRSAPRVSEAKTGDQILLGKIEQLGEAELDDELADLGIEATETTRLVEKKILLADKLLSRTVAEAVQQVAGFAVFGTIEAKAEDGTTHIGVIIGRVNNSLAWIRDAARGGGVNAPRSAPGAPLSERIPRGEGSFRDLYDQFGVRFVTDEKGDICVIAYGHAVAQVTKGMDPEDLQDEIDAAKDEASNNADEVLTKFLDDTVKFYQKGERGKKSEKALITEESVRELDGVKTVERATLTQRITDRINTMMTLRKSSSRSFVRGVKTWTTWTGNHPEYGTPIVGCVKVWTPAGAASAKEFNSTGDRSGPGFRATGGKTGARRSQKPQLPPGVGGGGGGVVQASAPVPQVACDGVVAVGSGASRDAAIVAALQDAIRQVCGVQLSASSSSDRQRSYKSRREMRVDGVCEQVKDSFLSASSESNIRVRSRGYVESYQVLSEGADGGGLRVEVCAQIPTFDPSNPRPGEKPTMVVLTPTARQAAFSVMGQEVDAAELCSILEAEVGRDLVKSKAFTVLERRNMGAILGEQAFIASGLTALREQVKLGKLSAGDVVLICEIDDVFAVARERTFKLTGRRIVKKEGAAKVSWRVVSVGTGAVLAQDAAMINLDDAGMQALERQYPGTPFATAVVRAAVDEAMPAIVAKTAPLRIAQVVGGKVFLNRGHTMLKPGQTLRVYRQGRELRDPTSGALLGRAESESGVIKVERCEEAFSVAVVISGSVDLADAGAICR